ncbi:MAG: hypothetical protein JRE61_08225 [Deltaproteobacteria bacterium]|nr:hypothetical protein [Deltaproteobacteria bacterium]
MADGQGEAAWGTSGQVTIGMLEYWNYGMLGSGPPAPLPARRAYRPAGSVYGSERKYKEVIPR